MSYALNNDHLDLSYRSTTMASWWHTAHFPVIVNTFCRTVGFVSVVFNGYQKSQGSITVVFLNNVLKETVLVAVKGKGRRMRFNEAVTVFHYPYKWCNNWVDREMPGRLAEAAAALVLEIYLQKFQSREKLTWICTLVLKCSVIRHDICVNCEPI